MAESTPEQRNPTDPAPPAPVPQLLVMPPVDGIPSIAWPGADGAPAWAIPVQVPPGTRGYALFLPLVPAPDAAGPVATAPAAPAGAVSATTPAAPAVAPPAATVAASPPPAAAPSPAVTVAAAPAPAAAGRSAAPDSAAGTATSDLDRPAESAAPPATAVHREPPAGYAPRPRPDGPVPFRVYQPEPSAWQRFREKHWPGPVGARGRAVPAGVLAGALGVACFVPLDRVGVGWFIGWLVLAAGVVLGVRRSADLPHSERWIRSGWAVAALALLAVPAVRNAWWLVTFSVLGALGCTALAIVGGRQVRSILFSLVATPYAAFQGIPWVRRHLSASRSPGMARRIGFSAGLTIVVLLLFGALLSSADVAFSTLLDQAVPDLAIGPVFRWVFLAAVGGLIAVAGIYTLSAPPSTSSLDTEGRGRFGLIEWAPACAALVVLFGGFVAVQFAVLFGGSRHVLKTAGLSYAEYARSGFWQLVAVTLLTLAVLAGLARWAKRDLPVERLLLRVLLGLLCVLSVVIVASALSRMLAYQRVYSFTGERIFVMSFELLLGTVFVMIALAGVRWKGRWIPRATVALAVLMLLGLAAVDPEGYAANRNAKRYEQSGKIDAWYLRALSADATPALTRLPDPVRRCTLSWIAEDLKEPDPWYAWNLGRSRARKALARVGPAAIGDPGDCRDADQYDLPKTRR
ncbi:hypothetical protein Asi03nite_64730 [Actinoplanes siamensis]|uniref:DUF4173 domain-containing protein n=1 Tax=Actinoplanes siamensis TaxID=1223317 RepID=A0A919TPJ1_9ACTN|nr:DUF4173 domain-containing protein [Actinoplanes siamensis]GIF08935.1 hypothetical protein Asi03nite_64730 [Actinoplanes siamensis]